MPAKKTATAGEAPDPSLTLVVKGEVIQTTFKPFASKLRKAIELSSKVDPKTDKDFGWCEGAVKKFKTSEEIMATAKEEALKQAEDLHAAFAEIDTLSEECRTERLRLNKLVTEKKNEVKASLVDNALDSIECADHLQSKFRPNLEEAIKGKRTIDSFKKALEVELTVINGRLKECRTVIDQFEKSHGADLIPDRPELELRGAEVVANELRHRLEAKEAREREAKAKAEAEKAKAEAEAERKKLEEASKPPAAPEPKAKAEAPAAEPEKPEDSSNAPEGAEWDAFMATIRTAFQPVKVARAALQHPANVKRGERLAIAMSEALQNS